MQVMPALGISDDDLCATCKYCFYYPGELSQCALNFPAVFDLDGYAVTCDYFSAIDHPEQNWIFNKVNKEEEL